MAPDGAILIWRRERDSNPRWAINPYSLSRGAPSATRPPLRDNYDQLFAGVIIPKNVRDDSRCALTPSGPPSRCDDVVSHLRCSARTLDGLLTHTPLAGERLQPLGHLSVISTINFCSRDYTEKNCLANDQVFLPLKAPARLADLHQSAPNQGSGRV